MKLVPIKGVNKNLILKFSCGDEKLDKFLKYFSEKNDDLGYGKTFALIDEEKLIGYFTLSSAQIRFEDFNTIEPIPKYPIPAIRIARLVVDKKYQGKGYGKHLLKSSLLKIIDASSYVGVFLAIVDAKESAVDFYKKYGFKVLNERNNQLFVTINEVVKAIELKK